ncbi:MAG TPA: KH domain-containing protein [Candidatus Krumholzibacteria bacterium]|nr:KH domain-containing protein [Candidatus Krumholzibacteria bacterium]
MAEATRQSIQSMIEYIATSLVDDRSSVEVKESTKEDYIVMELTVRPEDLGKVIGKNGQTARAIRTLVNAAASRAGEKIIFEIRE